MRSQPAGGAAVATTVIAAMAAVAAVAAVAAAVEPDAATLGRANAAVLHRLEMSPAAPCARSPIVGFDGRRVDGAAGIDAAAVRAAGAIAAATFAATVDCVRSPVHTDLGVATAVRLRRGAASLGAGVEWRRLQFAPGVAASRVRVRVGAGIAHDAVCAAGVVEVRSAGEAPRLAAAARWPATAGVALETEVERRPGQSAGVRTAIALDRGAWEAWCGYDTASAATALGAGVTIGDLGLAAAVRVHPILGWSPIWSCEWRP
jgi:hypothetical protein